MRAILVKLKHGADLSCNRSEVIVAWLSVKQARQLLPLTLLAQGALIVQEYPERSSYLLQRRQMLLNTVRNLVLCRRLLYFYELNS